MMKRRDLAWITNDEGEVIAVAIAEIDEIAQRWTSNAVVRKGEQLHLPGINLPASV